MKKAAKKAATAEKPEVKKDAKKSKFLVVKRLSEGGEVYLAGAEIELTAKRAKALGDLVKTPSGD